MRFAAMLLLVLAGCSGGSPRATTGTAPPAPSPEPAAAQVDAAQLGSPYAPDQPGTCADRRWGGWDGTPECAATAGRLIVGADRACATDADCTKMSGGNCDDNIVNIAATPHYRGWSMPCSDPTAGDCSPSKAACADGCCVSANDF